MPSAREGFVRSLSRSEGRRFVAFLGVGLVNTAFGYGVFTATEVVSGSPRLAVVAGNTLGVLFNYLSTGRLVFANRGLRALVPFVLGYGIVLAVNLAAVEALIRGGIGPFAAQAIALPWLVALAYAINRLVVFRPRGGLP
jgi:putative flippase GtrA